MLCSLDGDGVGVGDGNGNGDGDSESDREGDSDSDREGDSDRNGDGDDQDRDHHTLYVIVGGVVGVLVVLIIGVMTTLLCYKKKLCKRPEDVHTDDTSNLTSRPMATSLENPVFA